MPSGDSKTTLLEETKFLPNTRNTSPGSAAQSCTCSCRAEPASAFDGTPTAQVISGTFAKPKIVGTEGSSISNPYTPVARSVGIMNDRPVVPCWVVGNLAFEARTNGSQSFVPGGITAILAFFLEEVKAPTISTDSPGAFSRDIQ